MPEDNSGAGGQEKSGIPDQFSTTSEADPSNATQRRQRSRQHRWNSGDKSLQSIDYGWPADLMSGAADGKALPTDSTVEPTASMPSLALAAVNRLGTLPPVVAMFWTE